MSQMHSGPETFETGIPRAIFNASWYDFVLGTSDWFGGLYAETRSVSFPIRAFASSVVSFTYPDSVVAMRLGPQFGLPPDPSRPYHERVFRIEDLGDVVQTYGLPEDRCDEQSYDKYHLNEFERYIEVQVWSDLCVAT